MSKAADELNAVILKNGSGNSSSSLEVTEQEEEESKQKSLEAEILEVAEHDLLKDANLDHETQSTLDQK